MKTTRTLLPPLRTLARIRRDTVPLVAALALASPAAHASFLSGDALDAAADVLTWVVLVVAPVVGIAVFLLIHILPEKIAEKKKHPQVQAIQTLCLLSLVFGGMLWPLAWLWAYSKPVLYKIAYGKDEHDAEPPAAADAAEVERLRERIAELEGRGPGNTTAAGAGKG
jgi:CBS domain containing-hemolysin-like protein